MKLTQILFRNTGMGGLTRNLWPKGSVWHGKHRLVQPMGAGAAASQLKRLMWEYDNMKLLAKPYLTEAQEASQPDWTTAQDTLAKYEKKRLNMGRYKHCRMEDHLDHLNATKAWD